MPAETRKTNPDNLKRWADDLACPGCLGSLRFESATVACTGCSRTYPIVDGIPVLIPQRAIEPSTN